MSDGHTVSRYSVQDEEHDHAFLALLDLAKTPEASQAMLDAETALEEFEEEGQAALARAKKAKSRAESTWSAIIYYKRENPISTRLENSLLGLDRHFPVDPEDPRYASHPVNDYKRFVRYLSDHITAKVNDAANEVGKLPSDRSVLSTPPSVDTARPIPTNASTIVNDGEAPTV